MLQVGLIGSFVIAFFIGFRTKRFSFLIGDSLIGLGLGFLSVILYIKITPPIEAGPGVIALVPVMFIFFPALNIISAIIGGVVGILIGRKKKKN